MGRETGWACSVWIYHIIRLRGKREGWVEEGAW